MKEPELKKISINKVKVDLDNPNKMTEVQFESLKKTIEKYGYLVPIIVDKDLKIADGEHRYLAYKEMGMKEIPAYVLDIADPDRRMLRQVMNKLKGEHELYKDIHDFKIIGFEELNDLLQVGKKEFDELMSSFDEGLDLSTIRGTTYQIYFTRTIQLTEDECELFDKYTKGSERAGKKLIRLIKNGIEE